MDESNRPTWKQLLVEALTETDKEKITKLVHDTEGAIFLRLQELEGSADHHEERGAIKDACATLGSIQVNKLGWPSGLLTRKKASPSTQPSIQATE